MNEQAVKETGLVAIKNYGRSPEIMERFEELLGKVGASGYIASVIIAASSNNALQICEPKSIFQSALRAATLRLSCDPSTGQAYLVPFKGRATLIVGYKGLYNLAVRTGKYRYIQVFDVYEGTEISEDPMTGRLEIETNRTGNKIIGYISSFELLTGFSKAIYMTVDEIHAHAREYSQSYQRSDSAWKTHTRDMERKTILRRLLTHWGYLDPADAAIAMENPNADEAVEGDVYDLPPEDAVTPPQAEEPLTIEQASALLYGNDPNAAKPEPVKSNNQKSKRAMMSLEMAGEVTNHEGYRYDSMDDATLNGIANTMQQVLDGKKQSKYSRDEVAFRRDACLTILAHRNG